MPPLARYASASIAGTMTSRARKADWNTMADRASAKLVITKPSATPNHAGQEPRSSERMIVSMVHSATSRAMTRFSGSSRARSVGSTVDPTVTRALTPTVAKVVSQGKAMAQVIPAALRA